MAKINKPLDAALANARPFISDLLSKIRLHRTRDQDAAAAALLLLMKPLIELVPGDNAQRFALSLAKLEDALIADAEAAIAKAEGGDQ